MKNPQKALLSLLIQQEGSAFYAITNRWQPKDLIPDPYRRNLLKDVQRRFNMLSEAEHELQTLDRAPMYIRILRRMRLTVKQAQFSWRSDDLRFLKSITQFLSDYGIILRNLKIDQQRGRL
jgi:hypothetical protein